MTAADDSSSRRATNRWLVSLFVTILLTSTTVNLVRPMLSYRILELGLAPHLLGVVSASFVAVPVVLGLYAGRLVDRYGTVKVQVVGGTFFALATIGLGLTKQLVLLVLLSGLCGMGHLLVIVSVQTLIASGSVELLDQRFAHYALAASGGQMTGPLLGALIVSLSDANGAGIALVAGGGVALLGLGTSIAVRPPPSLAASVSAGHGASSRPGLKVLLGGHGVTRMLIVSCTVAAMTDVLAIYMPALGEAKGLSVEFVAILLAIRAGASMVSRLVLGRLVAAIGRQRLLLFGVMVSALSIAVLPWAPNGWTAIAAMVLAGLSLGLCGPLTLAWMASLTEPETRGTAMSFRMSVNRLGQVSLPALAGLCAGLGGVAGVFLLSSGLLAISGAPLARLRDHRRAHVPKN